MKFFAIAQDDLFFVTLFLPVTLFLATHFLPVPFLPITLFLHVTFFLATHFLPVPFFTNYPFFTCYFFLHVTFFYLSPWGEAEGSPVEILRYCLLGKGWDSSLRWRSVQNDRKNAQTLSWAEALSLCEGSAKEWLRWQNTLKHNFLSAISGSLYYIDKTFI